MCDMYKQCELTKSMDDGLASMVSWIPQRIAVVGKVVTLKDVENGILRAGWRVEKVGETLLSAKILTRQSRDYLRTRKASDV